LALGPQTRMPLFNLNARKILIESAFLGRGDPLAEMRAAVRPAREWSGRQRVELPRTSSRAGKWRDFPSVFAAAASKTGRAGATGGRLIANLRSALTSL
jgi:hypothetical protein